MRHVLAKKSHTSSHLYFWCEHFINEHPDELNSHAEYFKRRGTEAKAYLFQMAPSQDSYAFIPQGYQLSDHHFTIDEKPTYGLFHRSKTYKKSGTEDIKLHVYYNQQGDVLHVLVSQRDANNKITEVLSLSEDNRHKIRSNECLREDDVVSKIIQLTKDEHQKWIEEADALQAHIEKNFDHSLQTHSLQPLIDAAEKLAICEATANALDPGPQRVASKRLMEQIENIKKQRSKTVETKFVPASPMAEVSPPTVSPDNASLLKAYASLAENALEFDCLDDLTAYFEKQSEIKQFIASERANNSTEATLQAIEALEDQMQKITPPQTAMHLALIRHEVKNYQALWNCCIDDIGDPFFAEECLFFLLLIPIRDNDKAKVDNAYKMLDLLYKQSACYHFMLRPTLDDAPIVLDSLVGFSTINLQSLNLLRKLLKHGLLFSRVYLSEDNLLLNPRH